MTALKLPFDYVERIREIFDVFDKEADGEDEMSIDDMGTVIRAFGQIPTEAEVQEIIDEVDADGDYLRIRNNAQCIQRVSRAAERGWGYFLGPARVLNYYNIIFLLFPSPNWHNIGARNHYVAWILKKKWSTIYRVSSDFHPYN